MGFFTSFTGGYVGASNVARRGREQFKQKKKLIDIEQENDMSKIEQQQFNAIDILEREQEFSGEQNQLDRDNKLLESAMKKEKDLYTYVGNIRVPKGSIIKGTGIEPWVTAKSQISAAHAWSQENPVAWNNVVDNDKLTTSTLANLISVYERGKFSTLTGKKDIDNFIITTNNIASGWRNQNYPWMEPLENLPGRIFDFYNISRRRPASITKIDERDDEHGVKDLKDFDYEVTLFDDEPKNDLEPIKYLKSKYTLSSRTQSRLKKTDQSPVYDDFLIDSGENKAQNAVIGTQEDEDSFADFILNKESDYKHQGVIPSGSRFWKIDNDEDGPLDIEKLARLFVNSNSKYNATLSRTGETKDVVGADYGVAIDVQVKSLDENKARIEQDKISRKLQGTAPIIKELVRLEKLTQLAMKLDTATGLVGQGAEFINTIAAEFKSLDDISQAISYHTTSFETLAKELEDTDAATSNWLSKIADQLSIENFRVDSSLSDITEIINQAEGSTVINEDLINRLLTKDPALVNKLIRSYLRAARLSTAFKVALNLQSGGEAKGSAKAVSDKELKAVQTIIGVDDADLSRTLPGIQSLKDTLSVSIQYDTIDMHTAFIPNRDKLRTRKILTRLINEDISKRNPDSYINDQDKKRKKKKKKTKI